jgi:uncharacterized OsmC-like protein
MARDRSKWVNGTHSKSTVEGFYGLGAEQKHKSQFSFEADHPEIFASADNGATPVELVLAGLASCLTAGVAAVAQLREIQLRSVSATLEAGMDVPRHPRCRRRHRNGFDGREGDLQDRRRCASPDDIKALVPNRKSDRPSTTSSPTRPM